MRRSFLDLSHGAVRAPLLEAKTQARGCDGQLPHAKTRA